MSAVKLGLNGVCYALYKNLSCIMQSFEVFHIMFLNYNDPSKRIGIGGNSLDVRIEEFSFSFCTAVTG